ncbi:hypothetical protein OG474_35865 [Kribbella sp. NBC_01505]|uniref:hypothetical protein n=1 Tax=Kribbella sp. NBC_01505 TaxID=2903580 RepID=UPI00386D2271
MIKKIAVGIAAVGAVVAAAATALPAHAENGEAKKAGQVISLRDNGYGGCQKPGSTWGVNGALAVLTITDKVTWPEKQTIRVSSSDSDAVNTGCLNGYPYSGGTKRLQSTWTVNGQGIQTCTIGMGGGCTVSDTRVSDGYDTGTKANNDGTYSISSGGGSVSAKGTAGGRINNYTHASSATFAAASKVTIGKASNYAYRSF